MRWGLILLFILSIFLIIRSDIFAIRFLDVYLEKIGCVGSEEIKRSSNLLGQNFFLMNSTKTEEDFKKKFICIQSVGISKYFPNKIVLHIFGREPAAILIILKNEESTNSSELENFSEVESTPSAEASSNFVIDNEGVVYSNNIEQINIPKVYISGVDLSLGQKIKEEEILSILKIFNNLKVFGISFKDAKIYSRNVILVNTVPRIIFKLDQNLDIQLASLQLILNQAKIDGKDLEFIDLRFDKPVLKLAPKKN